MPANDPVETQISLAQEFHELLSQHGDRELIARALAFVLKAHPETLEALLLEFGLSPPKAQKKPPAATPREDIEEPQSETPIVLSPYGKAIMDDVSGKLVAMGHSHEKAVEFVSQAIMTIPQELITSDLCFDEAQKLAGGAAKRGPSSSPRNLRPNGRAVRHTVKLLQDHGPMTVMDLANKASLSPHSARARMNAAVRSKAVLKTEKGRFILNPDYSPPGSNA